jgi:hypothetical protein
LTPQRFATVWIARPDAADLDALTGMIESGLGTAAPAAGRIAEAMRTLEQGVVRSKMAVTQRD